MAITDKATVRVGCKLPSGIILEVGYSVTDKGEDGARHVSVQQHEDYQRVRIKGSRHADGSMEAIRAGVQLPPARLDHVFAITEVPSTFWERWKAAHKPMWAKLSKQGVLFEADGESNAKAMAIDKATAKSGFEPLDRDKLPVKGVETAKFDE